MSGSTRSAATPRHHISTACAACRRSKIKCDGKQPTCSQCAAKQRRCIFNDSIDRRKISLRKSVQTFTSRVKQLEEFIAAQGLQVPLPDSKHASTIDSLIAAFQSPEGTPSTTSGHVLLDAPPIHQEQNEIQIEDGSAAQQYQPPIPDHASLFADIVPDIQLGYVSNGEQSDFSADFNADWMLGLTSSDAPFGNFGMDVSTFTGFMDSNNESNQHSCLSEPAIEHPDHEANRSIGGDGSADDEDHKDVTGQISNRVGTLLDTAKGNWRFYGATSILHLSKDKPTPPFETKGGSQQERTATQLEFLELDFAFDTETIQHLIELYFKWQNPSSNIVDRDTFERARNAYLRDGEETAFYSEFLVYAMCALGVAFQSHVRSDLPKNLPEYFAKKAKAIIDIELDEPRVATAQGLALLSSFEAGATRDTRAWVYSGMAIRLAFDLGLHVSPRQYVEAGKMTAAEANARNVVIWGCALNDCGLGLYLGRPSHININDIASDKPIIATSNISASSVATTSSRSHQISPWDDQTSSLGHFNTSQAMLMGRWIGMYEIMSSLGHTMYNTENANNVELQALAQRTLDKFLEWRTTLPKELDLNTAKLEADEVAPQVLVLHMYYALHIITLHRPFCSKSYIQPRPLVGPGAKHARDMAVTHAVDIARMLACYKRLYTLRCASNQIVHAAFTAALFLVYAIVSRISVQRHEDLLKPLDICCSALADLGQNFDSAGRALEVLLAVKRSWQARMVAKM